VYPRQGARTNARLRAEAALRGVDPARLITARPMSKDQHLLRSRDYHLFLDTWKVGEIGVLLPNNQRQRRSLHVEKDVLLYALC